MQGLAALLFPAVLMLFALAMEKVQTRLDRRYVSRDHVEDFLRSAGATQMDTLAKEGFPAAMDELRDRRAHRGEPAAAAALDDGQTASPQRAS